MTSFRRARYLVPFACTILACGRVGLDTYLDGGTGGSEHGGAHDTGADDAPGVGREAGADATHDGHLDSGADATHDGPLDSGGDATNDGSHDAFKEGSDEAAPHVDAPAKDGPLESGFKPDVSSHADALPASDAKEESSSSGCDGGCPVAQSCVAGACVCPASAPNACGSGSALTCVDFMTDVNTCGTCTHSCGSPAVACIAGSCSTLDTSNVIGSWKFDEATGTTAADSSSSNNTATAMGGATIVPGKIGNARAFDGATGYVQTVSVVQVAETAYSIGAWFTTTSTGWQVIFANRGVDVTSGQSLTLAMGDQGAAGHFQWMLDVDGWADGVQSTATYNDGKWHYVVATWGAPAGTPDAASQFQLYVDGTGPVATTEFKINFPGTLSSPLSGIQGAQIGDSLAWSIGTAPVFWNGTLDEVTAWSRILSAADVTTLYNSGAGLSVP